mgnify:CR=1 FL=1
MGDDQRDVDVVARRVGVGADDVGLVHELLEHRLVDARRGDDREAFRHAGLVPTPDAAHGVLEQGAQASEDAEGAGSQQSVAVVR